MLFNQSAFKDLFTPSLWYKARCNAVPFMLKGTPLHHTLQQATNLQYMANNAKYTYLLH